MEGANWIEQRSVEILWTDLNGVDQSRTVLNGVTIRKVTSAVKNLI